MGLLPLLILLLSYTADAQHAIPIFHSIKGRGRALASATSLNAIGGNLYVSLYAQLGSNQQQVEVQLDTGSSPLWVGGTYKNHACSVGCFIIPPSSKAGSLANTDSCATFKSTGTPTYSGTCTGGQYISGTSTTFADDPVYGSFLAQYADGTTIMGEYVTDTLRLGDEVFDSFTFGLAYNETYADGLQADSTGILGLAPAEDINDSAALTSMFNDPTMTVKQFSFFFPSTLDAPGELFLGGTNGARYTGSIKWVPVNLDFYWRTASAVAMVGPNGQRTTAGVGGIIDTGSSLINGPTADVETLCGWYQSSGFTFDTNTNTCVGTCDAGNNLPAFSVDFGNNVVLPVNIANYFMSLTGNTDAYGNQLCALGLTGGSDGNSQTGTPARWIVGAVFLRQYYTVFDFTNYAPNPGQASGTGQVGFATPIAPAISRSGASQVVGGGVALFACMILATLLL